MPYYLWVIICLALSLAFAFLEIFIPSGGLLAFLSVSALLGSVVFAFLTNVLFGSGYLTAVIIAVPVFLWYAVQLFPRTFMGRKLLLNPEDDPALQPDLKLEALKQLIGKRGIAKSKMMLSGLIEIAGQRINAVSESETVEPGEEIAVVKIDGINVLVRKIPATVLTKEKAEEKTQLEPMEDPFG
ncbi:MAG: hypothetical protein LBN39_09250 [Planctomycetaceae bacterium]|jgi:membrane-bound serine protease (ClpP class)|nr:hypothetical protein [Planctomycetaceae bacterium]